MKDYMVHQCQAFRTSSGLLTMNPQTLYENLYAHYGPQHWWPGEGFAIGIGAILTQNTNWRNVEKALHNLREHNLLTPENIMTSDVELLSSLIKPAGFFHQKAESLRNFCKLWLENPSPTRDELLAVKGIGAETADCILLYLLETPEFVIDAYTVRISTRLGFEHLQRNNSGKTTMKLLLGRMSLCLRSSMHYSLFMQKNTARKLNLCVKFVFYNQIAKTK